MFNTAAFRVSLLLLNENVILLQSFNTDGSQPNAVMNSSVGIDTDISDSSELKNSDIIGVISNTGPPEAYNVSTISFIVLPTRSAVF
jgi:hypothetical protein